MTIQQEEIEFEPLPDYYATLNVSPTAKLQEIKKSFRKLAMQFHPDKNKEEGAQERFQELSEAYAILSDAEKRKEYDELYMDDEIQESFDDNDSGDSDSTSEEFGTGDNGSSSKSADEEFVPFEDDSKDGDEDLWADLDDETLFKVLKFLADNEYEISIRLPELSTSPDILRGKLLTNLLGTPPAHLRDTPDSRGHSRVMRLHPTSGLEMPSTTSMAMPTATAMPTAAAVMPTEVMLLGQATLSSRMDSVRLVSVGRAMSRSPAEAVTEAAEAVKRPRSCSPTHKT